MASYSWTHPCCERCWIEREGKWEEVENNQGAVITEQLVEVRCPVVVNDSDVEQCSFCGAPTFIGIFVREDPNKVAFPKEKT